MLQTHAADLVRILAAHGCADWVIAPGSRSAPLALALARLPEARCHLAGDERAAGYMALGMAAATGKPVGVVVTSGTAVLNLASAVAEAQLSEVSLFILTSDRPPEAIGQQDGQAVVQRNAFGANVKGFFELPTAPQHADERRLVHRLANDAALLALGLPRGPVQVNLPFREPFYPGVGEAYDFESPLPVWEKVEAPALPVRGQLVELQQAWQKAKRRIIVLGTMPYDADLRNAVQALLYYAPDVALAADPTSNLADLAPHNLTLATDFGRVSAEQNPELVPDLILHLGGPVTSRALRRFLRGCADVPLWRVQPYAQPVPDPFHRLTRLVVAEVAPFITKLGEHSFFEAAPVVGESYAAAWGAAVEPMQKRVEEALALTAEDGHPNEAAAALAVLEGAPGNAVVHLANSMPVRWAQWLWNPQGRPVWCNRGASGIDGCTATAVGYARHTDRPVLLLTGETAFHYDRNGLWAGEALPPNLKIVVINNGGGLIFRLIDGPAALPERDRFFENRHGLTAENVARDFGLRYHGYRVVTADVLREHLWEVEGPALVEVFCDPAGAEAFIGRMRQA